LAKLGVALPLLTNLKANNLSPAGGVFVPNTLPAVFSRGEQHGILASLSNLI